MSTRVVASSVVPLPIEKVWESLRDFTFPAKLLTSVIESVTIQDGKSASEIGAIREVKWKSGETRQQRLIELSDLRYTLSWETVAAEPPAETTASISTIQLTRVSELKETLVEWSAEFSSDITGAAITFEQKALHLSLVEIKRNLMGNKTVLILGAGLVAKPIIHYLAERGYFVIVASRTLERINKIIEGADNIEAVECDVETDQGKELLEVLTPRADAVISMLPYLFHVVAAKVALKYSKHFLTTSYVTPAMRELDEEAKSKGLVIINECGVDPGTDHMSAMKVIHEAQARGGKLVSFKSYCGGLPAPGGSPNPYGYKLSWAPRGVLLASRNDATFLKDGEVTTVLGKDLFSSYEVQTVEGTEYEAYPNRNSVPYAEIYGIPDVKTIIRGTYRTVGWCPTVKKFADLGLLDLTERADVAGLTYAQLLLKIVGASAEEKVREAVAKKLDIAADSFILDNFEWLGLLSETDKVGPKVNTYLDALCQKFVEKLQYQPGERDMIVMMHTFVVEFADRVETLTSSLVDFGIANGDTSMSRTVSYPVAIATRLVLEGHYTTPGLSIPVVPELYTPILKELESFNIHFVERTVSVVPK